MINDNQTNKLLIADFLKIKCPNFFSEFESLLKKHDVNYQLIPFTKDIWAVDYMPIQIQLNKFVQFNYNPDYLQTKLWKKTITNVDMVCENLKLKTIKSKITLDGGNVIKTSNKVIMCDKIFSENALLTRKELSNALSDIFEIDMLYFVPQQPKDIIGHADGMVRFLNKNVVIINDNIKENKFFQRSFKIALENASFEYIEIPYNPYKNKTNIDATGIYINFLEMKNLIIVPTFGMSEDDLVIKQFENIYKNKTIASIDCREIAIHGGILNCISWNIKI